MKLDYDRVVGYSPLEYVNQEKLRQLININLDIINDYYSVQKSDIILVAGAGLGLEAEFICNALKIKTVGIDINIGRMDLIINQHDLTFQKQDLMSLAFREGSFSLVYCYHVLEHVLDHGAVLREIHRVLRPGGILFVGFPNKNRLISYIGTSQRATVLEKIRWNLNDYLYRLKGRFENKYGAHAGFTEKEFIEDASNIFQEIYAVREKYMLLKYSRYRKLILMLVRIGLEEIVFPSNYFLCIKEKIG